MTQRRPIKLFTIGFCQHSAEEFFGKLQEAGVRRVLDVRLRPQSQLAGFAKQSDLPYFLRVICGIDYRHEPLLAPTQDLLAAYKNDKSMSWPDYQRRFNTLLAERAPASRLSRKLLHRACLLCSEHVADQCHRRLVAEYLQDTLGLVRIKHL